MKEILLHRWRGDWPQVMLAEEAFNEDQPRRFALLLRELNSLHRYEATCFGMRVKRRQIEGSEPEDFVFPLKFDGLAPGTWHEFSVEISAESISFNMGNQSGKLNGPLGYGWSQQNCSRAWSQTERFEGHATGLEIAPVNRHDITH